LSNISADFSRNFCFHLLIMLGCTSNRFDNSACVSRSLSASIATLALEAPENFLLFYFMVRWLKLIHNFQLN
jgi:hypothetical protein